MTLLQITAIGDSNAIVLESPVSSSSLFEGLAIGVLSIGIIALAMVIWRKLVVRPMEKRQAFESVVMLVTLPKEASSEKPQEITQEKIRERIAVAETLMSSVVSLTKPFRWWGGAMPLTFEIVAHQRIISFYVVVSARLEQVVTQHIHAQYPEANVEVVPDYNIFQARGTVVGGYLKSQRAAFFPFKTYKTLDSDPLNAITNVLSKIGEQEGAAFQIVFTRSSRAWRRKGKLLTREMQRGTHLADALRRSQRNIVLRALEDVGSIFTDLLPGSSAKDKEKDGRAKEMERLSPKEEEVVKAIEEKISKVGISATVRLVMSAPTLERATAQLTNIMSAFAQYTIFEYGNAFRLKRPHNLDAFIYDFIYRTYRRFASVVVNSEEFASIFHFPLPFTETPNIQWLHAKKAGPPVNLPTDGIILGESVFRGDRRLIRILPDDRRRHVYIIGKSGVGKSVLMTQMAIQDIQGGNGVGVIDPHGDLVEDILERIPPERADDVMYLNPADVDRPAGLNLLEYDPRYPEQKTFVINEMIKIFDRLYDLRQTGGPMFELYMRNAMLLVMEDPASGSTLMEIPKVLSDKDFRAYKISKSRNPVVNDFWVKEAEKAGGEAALANIVPYITSKLTQFIANDTMRPIVAQQKSAFNLREVMDGRKILLVNLSKGRLGDMNAYLIGMILVGKILMASLSRTDIPQSQRSDFYLYIDEFQNFITDSIATILSEARKYRLNLIIAHQYVAQLVERQQTTIRDAVLGNVGTMAAFRIGVEDAELLEKEFAPTFNKYDLMNIEAYHAYVRLLIGNQSSRPFTMRTFPLSEGNRAMAEQIHALSRLKYGRDRAVVEQEILDRVKKTAQAISGEEGDETAEERWKL